MWEPGKVACPKHTGHNGPATYSFPSRSGQYAFLRECHGPQGCYRRPVPRSLLGGGWDQLLVLAQQVALYVDVEQSVVQAGVAGLGVAFVEAHYHVDAGFPSGPTEFLGYRPGIATD